MSEKEPGSTKGSRQIIVIADYSETPGGEYYTVLEFPPNVSKEEAEHILNKMREAQKEE